MKTSKCFLFRDWEVFLRSFNLELQVDNVKSYVLNWFERLSNVNTSENTRKGFSHRRFIIQHLQNSKICHAPRYLHMRILTHENMRGQPTWFCPRTIGWPGKRVAIFSRNVRKLRSQGVLLTTNTICGWHVLLIGPDVIRTARSMLSK